MDNYDFCIKYITESADTPNFTVLDFGCGKGQIVFGLRNNKINAYGCDVFYEGSNYSDLPREVSREKFILKMNNNTIPFPDEMFDFVVSNQVMEHIEDMDFALTEIRRVLKPGGKVLSLFPDKGVWREGHCGILFLHWFKKKNKLRVYYACFLRMLGFGYNKNGKGILEWAMFYSRWLDDWTFYRNYFEIATKFRRYFTEMCHIEDYWLKTRLETKSWTVYYMPKKIKQFMVRKICGLVFVCKKNE